MERAKKLLIVGGGAASVSIVRSLVMDILPQQPMKLPLEIEIVEPRSEIGPGVAFSSTLESSRLNMPVRTMSITPKDSLHFADWLNSKFPHRNTNDRYLPRAFFGRYLSEDFKSSITLAARLGVSITTFKSECLELKRKGSRWHALLRNGERLGGDYLILAIGNQLPAAYPELVHTYPEIYMNDPWSDGKILAQVSRNDSILILGTGLTGIDVALTLLEHGHKGKVVLVSRSGRLPRVRPRSYEQQSKVFYSLSNLRELLRKGRVGVVSVEDIFEAIKRDTAGAGLDDNSLFAEQDSLPVLPQLMQDIDFADRPDHWHAVINQSDRLLCALWPGISCKERVRFLHSLYGLWAIYRHPMPLINANRLTKHLTSGALEVKALPPNSAPVVVNKKILIDIDGSKCSPPSEFDKLIDATGPNMMIGPHSSSLLRNLARDGLVKPDPCAGLSVDFDSSKVISNSGAIDNSFYAVGQITRGTHFYTNSMESIVHKAHQIAKQIASKIGVSSAECTYRAKANEIVT